VVPQPECPLDQSHHVAGSIGKWIDRPHGALMARRSAPSGGRRRSTLLRGGRA
jgi:hypothetical protein